MQGAVQVDWRAQQASVLHAMATVLPELGQVCPAAAIMLVSMLTRSFSFRWTTIPASLLASVVTETSLMLATPPTIGDGSALPFSVLGILGGIDIEASWLRRWMLTLPRRKTLFDVQMPHSIALVERLVSAIGTSIY